MTGEPRRDDYDHVDAILEQWARERPDLDASPMGILGRICRLAPLLRSQLTDVFREVGLSFSSFDVLASLRREGEPYELAPGDLARSMLVTPGAIAQRLAQLEQAGLICRRHDNPDRRVVTVALTAKGLDVVNKAVVIHLRNEQHILSGLNEEERAVLANLLRRLLVTPQLASTNVPRADI